MKLHGDDTIAAIATPLGVGAIAVIRVSGPRAIAITEIRFHGNQKLAEARGYTVHHGYLADRNGQTVDEVLVTVFHSPSSYTGEDSVEISCHGGVLVAGKVLQTILDAGARQADPGEFTKRAFLNGKMDLSQAEAVADIISAKSDRAYAISLNQLEGRLGSRIRDLRKNLLDLCSLVELDLDFSEEGLEVVSKQEALDRIQSLQMKLYDMIDSFRLGRVVREGVSVAILGRPNVGKSSLFNALLQEKRAIVTSVPGTTRDYLEESITLSGVLFRLSDTAGLRDSPDVVEIEGIRRTKEIARRSDILLLVRDISQSPYPAIIDEQSLGLSDSQKVIIVNNKTDIRAGSTSVVEGSHHEPSLFPEVFVSAKTGFGLDELRDQMVLLAMPQGIPSGDGCDIVSMRHTESLSKALELLDNAKRAVDSGTSGELVSVELREASNSLAEITGDLTSDDVLNSIFRNFCIGK